MGVHMRGCAYAWVCICVGVHMRGSLLMLIPAHHWHIVPDLSLYMRGCAYAHWHIVPDFSLLMTKQRAGRIHKEW